MMETLKGLNVDELGGLQGYCVGIADGFEDRRPALAAFWRELAGMTRQALAKETLKIVQAQRELHRGEHGEVQTAGIETGRESISSYLRSMNWTDRSTESTAPEEWGDDDDGDSSSQSMQGER